MTDQIVDLRHRLQRSNLLAARLQGALATNTARQVELTADVSAAKARQGLADEVKRVFEALQARAHERSVGVFDRLLTAILNDVLPEEGRVRLLPKFRDNTTWLDVAIEKMHADADGTPARPVLEDILDGNGGAVTNVVSTGLRFASLSRTKNRPLMVLDEPDCWIKPERIPAFINVISQVAEQTGVQTFFISHFDDPSAFSGVVNVVRLARDAQGNPRTEVVHPLVNQWENDDVPGIRKIVLKNFRKHVHTEIPCFPGATALVGDNNLGKSTCIVSTLKAVAYGESDDSMIRHGCEQAEVTIHLEKGQRIEWVRNNKRSPAVMYRYFVGDNPTPVHEGRPKARNTAPDWVTEVLGIARVDDLDIQVGNQKAPVFLLNETASKRAQILSLGRESGHLRTLMKRYEEVRSGDNETVKRGEAELARLNFNVERMADVPVLAEKLGDLTQTAEALITHLARREQVASLVRSLEDGGSRLAAAERECQVLSQLPALPQLQDVSRAKQLADSLERSEQLLAKLHIPAMPQLPKMTDTAAIAALGVRLTTSSKRLELLESVPAQMPALPQLQDLGALERSVASLVAGQQRLNEADTALKAAAAAETRARDEFETLKQKLGVCPLCDTHLTHGADHVHAH
ncbi:recombination protein F [compost metagenome]